MTMTTKTPHGTSHASKTSHAAAATEEAPAAAEATSTKYVPPPVPAVIAATSNPTNDEITAMIAQLDAMAPRFGAGATPLTIEERRKLLKIRPGGETLASGMMQIADRYGLAIPGVSSADVEANIELAKNMGLLMARFHTVLGLASDTQAKAQSRVWSSATKAYSTMTRLVPEYPSLQRELTPMASFLAIKYKDAPTSLRTQEKKTLSKARVARQAKKDAEAQTETAAQAAQAQPQVQASAAAPAAAASVAVKSTTGANAPS
jgi:hypothetical protein